MSSGDAAQDYFFASLDFHLRDGNTPNEALKKATYDYQFVFLVDDGRLPIARAAEIALTHLRRIESENFD